jgi:hypothetical protein
VELTPLPLAKLAHASLGVAVSVLGVGLWVDGFAPEPAAKALAAIAVIVGALMVVRSVQIGVECRGGEVQVRGLVRRRLVPRASIEELTSFPALRWRDSAGRSRWTPIAFLSDSPAAFSHYKRHNAAELDRLRMWITRPRP